jgi:hypothetical protein
MNALPDGVTVAALVKWKQDILTAKRLIGRTRVDHVMPQLGRGSEADTNLDAASDALMNAAEGISAACEAHGIPRGINKEPSLSDLASLASMDTQDARKLLAVLETAQEIAERVDAQRGHTIGDDIPLMPGESRGTDLADAISMLCYRLRIETDPPKGKGE